MAAVPGSGYVGLKKERFDQAAICLSVACLLHCLAVPLLLVAAPWLSLGLLGAEWFHLSLVVAIVPLSLMAFRGSRPGHQKGRVLAPALAGLGLIVLAAVLEVLHLMDHAVAAGMTSIGGILLIVGHWRNLRGRVCLARSQPTAPQV